MRKLFKYKQVGFILLSGVFPPPPPLTHSHPFLCLGEEEKKQVVEWAYAQPQLLQGQWRSRFNGLAQPTRVSENLSLYLLPRPAGYFFRAALASSLITS